MRVGTFATHNGKTYSARAGYYSIILLSPTVPSDPGEWEPTSRGRWAKKVSRDDVSRLYKVFTEATFESLPVSVDSVDDVSGMVGIIARPGSGGAGFQIAHPPHSELSPMHGNAASLDGWYGNVEVNRLTNVREFVEELDLSKYGNPEPS